MRDLRACLADIQLAGADILVFVKGLEKSAFAALPETDRRTYRAVENALTEISDVVEHLPPEMLASHPEINWGGFAELRKVITHRHFRIELAQLWLTVTEELPALLAVIDAELAQLSPAPQGTKLTGRIGTDAKITLSEERHPELAFAPSTPEHEPLMPVNGSYRQATVQRIDVIFQEFAQAEANGDREAAPKLLTDLVALAESNGELVDNYATELVRVERLKSAGPTKQRHASTVLRSHIMAAAIARWDAEPGLSKKALALTISMERPDLGSWRTIEDQLPTEKQRELWSRKARRHLQILARLGEKNTWGDPACRQAINKLQPM